MSSYDLYDLFQDELYLNSNDINSEANKNHVSLTLSSDDAKNIDKKIIYNFIAEIIENKKKKALKMTKDKVVFYLWYDAQSLQLSYSLYSKKGILPFGCKTKIISNYAEIIDVFIKGCADGFPNFEDMTYDDFDIEFDKIPKVELPVYVKEL